MKDHLGTHANRLRSLNPQISNDPHVYDCLHTKIHKNKVECDVMIEIKGGNMVSPSPSHYGKIILEIMLSMKDEEGDMSMTRLNSNF